MNRSTHVPLVLHLVHAFDVGGMENGIVNLINATQGHEVRHAVVALTGSASMAGRIHHAGVEVICLRKQAGKDPRSYVRLAHVLRRLRPDVLHSRNIGTLDFQIVGLIMRVPVRVHGEHGRDVDDPDGSNVALKRRRRLLLPLVHRVVTVSEDLRDWLVTEVGIRKSKVAHICNGVDTERFSPESAPEIPRKRLRVGSVTRLEAIKDPANVINAVLHIYSECSDLDFDLAMLGDGSMKGQLLELVSKHGLGGRIRLVGAGNDVPGFLRSIDIFVLGSRSEGISNTILEAMACGLPIVATKVGGTPEMVDERCAILVPPEDSRSLGDAISELLTDEPRRIAMGRAARVAACERFSINTMASQYSSLYQREVSRCAE